MTSNFCLMAEKLTLSHCAMPPDDEIESSNALERDQNSLHVIRHPVDVALSLWATTLTKPMFPDRDIWAFGINHSLYNRSSLHKRTEEVVPTAWMRQHLRNMARDCRRMRRNESTISMLEAWAHQGAAALVDYGVRALQYKDVFDLEGHMQRWERWARTVRPVAHSHDGQRQPEVAMVKYEHLADMDVAAALGEFMGLGGPYEPTLLKTHGRYNISATAAANKSRVLLAYVASKRTDRLRFYVRSPLGVKEFLQTYQSASSWYEQQPPFQLWNRPTEVPTIATTTKRLL